MRETTRRTRRTETMNRVRLSQRLKSLSINRTLENNLPPGLSHAENKNIISGRVLTDRTRLRTFSVSLTSQNFQLTSKGDMLELRARLLANQPLEARRNATTEEEICHSLLLNNRFENALITVCFLTSRRDLNSVFNE